MRAFTGRSPTQLRVAKGAARVHARQLGLELRLPYKKPFDWWGLLVFLQQRAIAGMELVRGNSYQRTIEIDGAQGFLTVEPDEAQSRLRVTSG